MEDDISVGSSLNHENSPEEENVPQEAINENSSSSGSSHSSSETTVSGRSSNHNLYRTTKHTNLLELKDSITEECLHLISNTLETASDDEDSWTNTRRFMAFRDAYICRIPKRLVTNGIIHQTLKFISTYTLSNLQMKLQLMFRNRIIDEWQFEKGLVHPGVITRWETTINRSPNTEYFDEKLTACTLLRTEFYDEDQLLLKYDTCIVFT